MTLRPAVAAVLASAAITVAGHSQEGPGSVVFRAPVFTRFEAAPRPDNDLRIGGNHWETGAIIGGATFGVITALLAVTACSMDDSGDPPSRAKCGLVGFTGGALVGGVIGGMIGTAFPRED